MGIFSTIYVSMMGIPYTYTDELIEEVFSQGEDPPFIFLNNIYTFERYMRINHVMPLSASESKIQLNLIGNGIAAIAVVLLGLCIDFKVKWLKIISIVLAFLIMGFSIFGLWTL